MQVAFIAMSFWNELVVTTTKKLEPIKKEVELTIIFYIFYLPTYSMEVPIVVVNIHVEELEELITLEENLYFRLVFVTKF